MDIVEDVIDMGGDRHGLRGDVYGRVVGEAMDMVPSFFFGNVRIWRTSGTALPPLDAVTMFLQQNMWHVLMKIGAPINSILPSNMMRDLMFLYGWGN